VCVGLYVLLCVGSCALCWCRCLCRYVSVCGLVCIGVFVPVRVGCYIL
jgi:hypothetical protein